MSEARATSPTIIVRDFPGWLPPMLVKELRQGLRTRGFVGTLVVFQLLMLILTLVALSTQNATTPSGRMAGAAFSGFFWAILAVQLIFMTPSRALGGLQLEVESRTLDLLMLTRLTAWRVILGKWISLLAQATLLLVAMTPYLVVRYFTDNADIVDDIGRCLGLLCASAVLTAAALWGSGVAKVLRVMMAIALVYVMLSVLGTLGPMMSGRGGRGPFANTFEFPFDLLNAAVFLAFFLVSAVRNIAPPAENHSLFVRILPILTLIPAPIAHWIGADSVAVRQLIIAAVFSAFVLLFELAAGRGPMPTHWRDWHRRGVWGRMVGRLVLPGWPSAFLFGALVTALWAGTALVVLADSTSASSWKVQRAAWLALLALSGLAFPAVMQSFVRKSPVPRSLLYFGVLVLPALLAGGGLWLAESRWKITALRTVMETMPFSSFLFALNKTDPTSTVFAAQGIVAALVLVAAAWRSRVYWRQLNTFAERDRAAVATHAPAA